MCTIFMHALLRLEYPHTRDCHGEGIGNVQLLDDCIVRLSGQISLIIGYVKNANDFRNCPRPSDKGLPIVIAPQWRTKIMRKVPGLDLSTP